MKIIAGDMFDLCEKGDALCVTTNGVLNKDGKLVMGKGVAKDFRDMFDGVDELLGNYVLKYGNRVFYIGVGTVSDKEVSLFSFPTKHNWRDKSDLVLIEQSCIQLKQAVEKFKVVGNVYLTPVGCGNGQLDWKNDVKPIVEKYLPEDKYFICFKD